MSGTSDTLARDRCYSCSCDGHSEFGIPSFPDIKTVDFWLDGNKKDRWAQSKLIAQHDRAGSHERRFAIVMNENFRLTSDIETCVVSRSLLGVVGD